MIKLEQFIKNSPSLANVPYFLTRVGYLSSSQALQYLRTGQISELELGMDPTPEELSAEYYKRLAEQRPTAKIFIIGREVTFQQAAEEIRKGTDVGRQLVSSHQILLEEMKRRM